MDAPFSSKIVGSRSGILISKVERPYFYNSYCTKMNHSKEKGENIIPLK